MKPRSKAAARAALKGRRVKAALKGRGVSRALRPPHEAALKGRRVKPRTEVTA